MSTAFYKSKTKPQLIATFIRRRKTLAVWTTPCIVHNFGKNQNETSGSNVLINPSNPELSGVSNFPYFPRGGPVPKLKPKSMHKDWQPLGYVSNWGGMEVGNGMLYPVSVIDGLVHQAGGPKLAFECKMIHFLKGGCPVGNAAETSPGGDALYQYYDRIIHTTPPFFKNHNDENGNKNDTDIDNANTTESLHQCYKSAFDIAFDSTNQRQEWKVACPILGAGARGFPYDIAINVAAHEGREWLRKDNNDCDNEYEKTFHSTLAFGIPNPDVAKLLVETLNDLEDDNKQADVVKGE